MNLRICGSFKSANLQICDLLNSFAEGTPLLIKNVFLKLSLKYFC
jgi:hypothetical protein